MRASTKSATLVFVLFCSYWTSKSSKDSEPEYQRIQNLNDLNDLDDSLNKHQFFLLASYDPAHCLHCFGYLKRLLTSLGSSNFTRDYNIGLGLINTQTFKAPVRNNQKPLATGLVFIRKGEARSFNEFNDLIEYGRPYKSYHSKVFNQTLTFIQKYVRPVQQVESWTFFEAELRRYGRVGLFFSSETSKMMDKFKSFARRNSNAALYYTTNELLFYEILARLKIFLNDPVVSAFAFLINDPSSKIPNILKFEFIERVESSKQLQRFWTIHRFSSIIRDITWFELTEAVKGSGLGVLMLVTTAEYSGPLGAIFESAIGRMPKTTLFAHLERPHPITQLSALNPVSENGIIFLFKTGKGASANVIGMTMRSSITEDNILKFLSEAVVMQSLAANMDFRAQFKSVKADDAMTNRRPRSNEFEEDEREEIEDDLSLQLDDKYSDLMPTIESSFASLLWTITQVLLIILIK